MRYLSVKEAGEKWKMSERQVQLACQNGAISGAARFGRSWAIPADAEKPIDHRRKEAKSTPKAAAPPIRRCPNLIMTDLFAVPGAAEKAITRLPETGGERAITAALLTYYRGDIDGCYSSLVSFADKPLSREMKISYGLLLSACAMYKGSLALWNEARDSIKAAACKGDGEREERDFWLAAADSAIYDYAGFPARFCEGHFDVVSPDAYPAARFFYVKQLFLVLKNFHYERETEKFSEALRMLPLVGEPLLAQTRAEGVFLVEIYLNLLCSIAYHYTGNIAHAAEHVERAIDLALPDGLYSPLAEYASRLDFLLFERLRERSETAFNEVKRLAAMLGDGWTKLHNQVLKREASTELTPREREVSTLALILTNQEIAGRLHLAENTVKNVLKSAAQKTGAKSRYDLAKYL